MPKPLVERCDTLDDRRELHILLAKLRPRRRVQFLQWACTKVTKRQPKANVWKMMARIEAAERGDQAQDDALTREVYLDLWMLGVQYGLDIGAAAAELERRVRAAR